VVEGMLIDYVRLKYQGFNSQITSRLPDFLATKGGKSGATRTPPLHLGDRATPSTPIYQTFRRRLRPLVLSDN
jgi:hypothetical protein